MQKLLLLPVALIILLAFNTQNKTKVIFFGDSITRLGVEKDKKSGTGYILRLDSMLKREKKADQYELMGAGIDGNKVYDLYLRMEDDVLSKNPDVVFIYVGINDIWHKTLLGTGTDADKFEKFYQAIINKLKSKGIKIVLCTPAAIGERTDFSNQQDGDLNRYSEIIRGLSEKNKLLLVDLRKDIMQKLKIINTENKEKEVLTYDRVHMNNTGNQFLADEMWKALMQIK
ncbi:MAG TPA: GDSL-type esterase/lipase family protein [Chitinophagaceae bacterium]|nr:GDSL-type esterase/lipase family protein [Chitinophagaceae bacterium]